MRYLIAVLLSALLIGLAHQNTPVNNSTTVKAKATHVQAVAPEKATEVKSSALTEQKTAVEPEAVTVTQPEPQSQAQGCAAYLPLIDQYSWNHKIAYAVMQAENTSCNPSKDNSGLNADGSTDYGLFQVNSIHSDMVGGNLNALRDPATNIAVAYKIYSGSGWAAWSTYKSGRYLAYLNQ